MAPLCLYLLYNNLYKDIIIPLLSVSAFIRLNQGGVPETPKRPSRNPTAVASSRSGKGVRFNNLMKHVTHQYAVRIPNPDLLGAAPRWRANLNLGFKVQF